MRSNLLASSGLNITLYIYNNDWRHSRIRTLRLSKRNMLRDYICLCNMKINDATLPCRQRTQQLINGNWSERYVRLCHVELDTFSCTVLIITAFKSRIIENSYLRHSALRKSHVVTHVVRWKCNSRDNRSRWVRWFKLKFYRFKTWSCIFKSYCPEV